MLAKLALIFFGLLFLLCVWFGRKGPRKEEPIGEKITVEDVVILLQALNIPAEDLTFDESDSSDTEYLLYRQYIEISEMMGSKGVDLPGYEEIYDDDHALLKNDWYKAYKLMLAHLDTESSIWETTVFLLGADAESREAYTDNGGMKTPYQYHSTAFENNVLQRMKVYVKGSELLTVTEILSEKYKLSNVWVMESADGILECFYHQVAFQARTDKPVERESVADLTFQNGSIIDTQAKSEKIHGKLLRMTEDEMEIEDCGIYQIAEDMEVYKLYGSLETKVKSDLRIGYADTDFVIYEDKICAGLISEQETADKIRVLLKNMEEESNYYEEVELVVDGETIQVDADDLKVGERRIYQCSALTDKVLLQAGGVVKGDGAYRGSIECYRTEDGMVLINELPLEEYLYTVVHSEMPAYYPVEALKSQAICARTYAYRYIQHAGLPEVGAHVDDTTSYQVYHNVSEDAATTTAVKETRGIVLTYQGEPAQNFYYSTSCGTGTDVNIWQSDDTQDFSYLQAVRYKWKDYEQAELDVNMQREETPEDLSVEENFYQFITSVGEQDLEKEEPWYRWTYTAEDLDTEAMQDRIQARYESRPETVLTRTKGDYYVSQPIEKLGNIKELSIVKRGAGGVAEELLIETDTGIYKIIAEYNIRIILCDKESATVLQDGTTIATETLLPSGFFVLKTVKRNGNVTGYSLTGGGYGHGVGMSQNGAKILGAEGVPCDTILEFFFPGCELCSIKDL